MATERERKVFYGCTIVRKSQEEHNGNEVWTVTLNKEIFGGKWDSDITRVAPDIANRLERGQQYNLMLERQNKKKADYSGDTDWMWYWGITGIADGDDAQQAARPTGGAAPRQQTTTISGSWGTLDERIAWNSAVNNSVSVVPYDRGAVVDWTVEVSIVAHHVYTLIRRGPLPPAEDAPQENPEAPDVDEEDVLYLEEALNSQEPFPEGRV